MVDIDLIRQSIVQHWMMRYCGVEIEQWAFDFMFLTLDADISAAYCIYYFVEWINA